MGAYARDTLKVLFCETGYAESRRRLAAVAPEYDLVTTSKDRVLWSLANVDVIVPYGARIDRAIIERGTFGLIQQFGVGLETVDVAAATERGVWVARVPSAHTGNAESVAEHAILLMLAIARKAAELPESVRRGVIGEPAGAALAGKTACIIGLGGVGAALARRLQAFDMRLRGVRAQPILGAPSGVGMRVYPSTQLHTALAEADFVIVCSTMDASNVNLIDAAALRAMKPKAVLVNVARGGLVDTAALQEALASGHIAAAGLDVVADEPVDPQSPLLAYNVIVTPHIAGVTDLSYDGIAREVAANLRRYARGEQPMHVVNAPVRPRGAVTARF